MHTRILILGFVAVMVAGASPAAATVVSAGASGQCYDTDGTGGQDSTRVTADTEGSTLLSVKLLTVTGALAAVTQFVQGTIDAGEDACTNGDTTDYLEADASMDGTGVQVCYDGEGHDGLPLAIHAGSGPAPCPTAPAGPGAPG